MNHVLLNMTATAFVLIAIGLGRPALASPRIVSFGPLQQGQENALTQAQGISADGALLVGYGTLPGNNRHYAGLPRLAAISWTPSGAIRRLAYLPGGGEHAAAEGVSANGKVIVGVSDGSEGGRYLLMRAVRWTATGEVRALPLPDGFRVSSAFAVSADGDVIIGHGGRQLTSRRALRWQGDAMARDLGTLGGGQALASAVSADGLHVAGVAENAERQSRAFVWSARHGMRDLGALPGRSGSLASAISADGGVVVGSSADDMANLALPDEGEIKGFIWHRRSGLMAEIANSLGGGMTMPTAVSSDGKIVVGVATDGQHRRHAFRWTQEGGMTVHPAEEPELQMSFVRGLTADGRFSAGRLRSDAAFRAEWR